jgi:hypothetical protein
MRLRFHWQNSSPPSKAMIGICVNGASPADCSFCWLNGKAAASASARSGPLGDELPVRGDRARAQAVAAARRLVVALSRTTSPLSTWKSSSAFDE